MKQVQELLALLHDAGHADFRDARGPMGFTQRQAAGKFTGPEATAFIDGLLNAESPEPAVAAETTNRWSSTRRQSLDHIPTDQLVTELQDRGWIVTRSSEGP
jgi:hypothetical protein